MVKLKKFILWGKTHLKPLAVKPALTVTLNKLSPSVDSLIKILSSQLALPVKLTLPVTSLK